MDDKNYITPWFGSWPPVVKGDVTMKTKKSWREKWTTPILLCLTLIGLVLVIISPFNEGLWWVFARDIGIALLVTGILGATVDKLLNQQLAENAFKASIGYLLPDELRGELQWIYQGHILCTKYEQICELKPIDDDTCEIYVDIHKTLQNIGKDRDDDVKIQIAIDEWFHPQGKSEIISFGYSTDKERKDNFIPTREKFGALRIEQNISLASKEKVRTWAKIREIKRTNDVSCWGLTHPTVEPQITVKAYKGLEITPSLGHRQSIKQTAPDTWVLPGTLLPGQRIEIRWVKTANINAWLRENDKAEETTKRAN